MAGLESSRLATVFVLLPLNRSRRLRSQVVENTVDARHLGDDALHDGVEYGVRNLLDGCTHRVAGVDRADDDEGKGRSPARPGLPGTPSGRTQKGKPRDIRTARRWSQ